MPHKDVLGNKKKMREYSASSHSNMNKLLKLVNNEQIPSILQFFFSFLFLLLGLGRKQQNLPKMLLGVTIHS